MIVWSLETKAEEPFESNVRLFFSTLSKPMVTRQDFTKIFGPCNEAEMAVTLKKKFPNLPVSSDSTYNQEALDFLEEIHEDSNIERSEFLFCLKELEPALSKKSFTILGKGRSRYLDMHNYLVVIKNKKYEFEYTESGYLNNIYMPNSVDLYKRIESCKS
jgi:hypothetical protein